MATSLVDKLGIRAGTRCTVIGAPEGLAQVLTRADARFVASLAGEFDHIHLFVTRRKALDTRLPRLKHHLAGTGSLWVSWPKGGANGTDLSLQVVIATGYAHGLVESKTIGVDATWSAIKFTFPKKGKRYDNRYGRLPDGAA